MVFIPESQLKQGNTCSFIGGYNLEGNTIHLSEKIMMGRRIYEASDWPQFRDAVNAQNSFVDEPVMFRIKN